MTPVEQIQANILSLQAELQKTVPNIPTILSTIHKQLLANPDCVTLLKEEEIATIVSGLDKQGGMLLTQSMVKKAASSPKSITAKLKTMNLDTDL